LSNTDTTFVPFRGGKTIGGWEKTSLIRPPALTVDRSGQEDVTIYRKGLRHNKFLYAHWGRSKNETYHFLGVTGWLPCFGWHY